MSEEKTPVGASVLPPGDTREWVGPSGLLRVLGVDYHLPNMDVGALNTLQTELALQADMLRNKLANLETERALAGSLQYDAMQSRNRARLALALKKRQMSAIHAEFSRRKSLIPPLEDFAFSAVREVYGEVGLGRVMTRARALQDQRRKELSRKGKPMSKHRGDRENICGSKVRYEDQKEGAEAIEDMEAAGQNVAGLSVYGPCPWCGKFHVGHRPDYLRKKRQKERLRQEAQATQPS